MAKLQKNIHFSTIFSKKSTNFVPRMTKKEKYSAFVTHFSLEMPEANTELVYANPFQLLIAVILSAQCTDKRVNLITPPLFNAYPTPSDLAQATPEDVFAFIHSVSYPNNKSRHLVGMAKMLVDKYSGTVPDNLDDLIQLPGVGRKTANVIQSVIFGKPTMAVDTHVFRVSHRIGLVSAHSTTPLSVERELTKYLPKEVIPQAHHWLILHGRYVCTAINPKCSKCKISSICEYYQKNKEN